MKAIRLILFVTGVLLLLASPLLLLGPVHDWLGRLNTKYSSKFSREKFAELSVGMPRSAVVALLGPPLDTYTLTNYPVWAISDAGVRARYGKDAELQIETLSFSRSKRSGDYEMVSVWIGPDTNVIHHCRGVTD